MNKGAPARNANGHVPRWLEMMARRKFRIAVYNLLKKPMSCERSAQIFGNQDFETIFGAEKCCTTRQMSDIGNVAVWNGIDHTSETEIKLNYELHRAIKAYSSIPKNRHF